MKSKVLGLIWGKDHVHVDFIYLLSDKDAEYTITMSTVTNNVYC